MFNEKEQAQIAQVFSELNDVMTDWICTTTLSDAELHRMYGMLIALKGRYEKICNECYEREQGEDFAAHEYQV